MLLVDDIQQGLALDRNVGGTPNVCGEVSAAISMEITTVYNAAANYTLGAIYYGGQAWANNGINGSTLVNKGRLIDSTALKWWILIRCGWVFEN